ncbi:hypothetical protein PoB_000210600 [Plakobranchus ocellatus]|uniref:Uncharacterized protein n=1 Tax=Plakobranchus ocellatus TaxID=259542 RepID=A0AAV3XXP0_9GAST|nr:hypothetical protein PoB_000210600 [Plakobranchus ocellatus]
MAIYEITLGFVTDSLRHLKLWTSSKLLAICSIASADTIGAVGHDFGLFCTVIQALEVSSGWSTQLSTPMLSC